MHIRLNTGEGMRRAFEMYIGQVTSKNIISLGGRGGWITRSRDRDHPSQHGETPSLLKIQKISWEWWCMPVIPATWEVETAVS